MYVYLIIERDLYTVGHYDPAGKFISVEDFTDELKARKLVNYLNGGLGYFENDWLKVSTSNSDAI